MALKQISDTEHMITVFQIFSLENNGITVLLIHPCVTIFVFGCESSLCYSGSYSFYLIFL